MKALNEKEITVLQLVADGENKRIIASKIGVNYQTVKNILRDVRGKLDAPRTENAVATGIRRGLID